MVSQWEFFKNINEEFCDDFQTILKKYKTNRAEIAAKEAQEKAQEILT